MKNIDQARLSEAVETAAAAFWASVVSSYPEITTGDIDPGAQAEIEEAMASAVKGWVSYNHPAMQNNN